MEEEEGGGGGGDLLVGPGGVELHLCIARALQRLSELQKKKSRASTLLSAITIDKELSSRRKKEDESDEDEKNEDERDTEGEEGEEEVYVSKAKEASVLSCDSVELELELEEEEQPQHDGDDDDEEEQRGRKHDDRRDDGQGDLLFDEMDRVEEEWRMNVARMSRRMAKLRTACQRWQEHERERLRQVMRNDVTSTPVADLGTSPLDLFIRSLIVVRNESRGGSPQQQRHADRAPHKNAPPESPNRAKARKRTKAKNEDSSVVPKLELRAESSASEQTETSESPRIEKTASTSDSPRLNKVVSFVTAEEQRERIKSGAEQSVNVSNRHRRRSVEEQDLPSHKKSNKKSKKDNKKKGGSFLEKASDKEVASPRSKKHRTYDPIPPIDKDRIIPVSPREESIDKGKEKVEIAMAADNDDEPLSRHDSNTTLYNSDPDESDSDFDDMDDEDMWESDEMTNQQDLPPPDQVLRGIVGLVGRRGAKPVLCEVGGYNLNCCNLLLQGSSKLEEPIIEKKGPAKDIPVEGGNVPSAFNILLSPQRNPSDVLELAADSDSDMKRWLAFFQSIYTSEGPPSAIQGFLWLRMSSRKMRLSPGSWTGITNISNLSNITDIAVATKWQWQRYYCICDPTRFEWFALSYVKVLPLHSVIQVHTSTIEPTKTIKFTSRRNSKSAFIGWGEDDEKVVLDPRYYRYKISLIKANSKEFFSFLTSSVEEMHSWNKAIVSHQRHHDSDRVPMGGSSISPPSLIEEKSPKPERSAGETLVRSKYREFRHWRNVKVMKDDEDNEVLKIRSSCRQFRKKAEQQFAFSQWRKQRSRSAANLRANLPPLSPRVGSKDDSHPDSATRSPSLREINEDKKFFVLSLDGGGTRCIMQTIILQRLVQVFPDLLSKFDTFAGVSGGSINAAMLAMGLKPDLMADIQKFMAPSVFGKGKRQATLELKGLSLRRAKYSADPLLILGEELFQGQPLSRCPSRLLMVTFTLDNEKDHGRTWEPKVYHNIPMKKTDDAEAQPFAMKKKDLEDTPLWEHCLASSAAPTYFKSHRKHVDGGVVSNTASSAVLACLIGEGAEQPIKPSNLHILNIGTGRIVQYLEGEDDEHDWGIIQWGPKLPGLLFAAHDTFGHQLSATILGERYHRVDPFLEKPLGMDDASSLPALIHIAQHINLDDTIEWIRHFMYADSEGISLSSSPSSPAVGQSRATRNSTGQPTRQRKKAMTESALAASSPSLSPSIPPALNVPRYRGSQTWDSAWFNVPRP